MKDGLIKKASTFLQDTCYCFIYILTAKGKQLATKAGIDGQWYRSASVSHDIAVLKKYMSLPIEARLTWQTEKELHNFFNQKINLYEELKNFNKADELSTLYRRKKG